MRAVISTQVEPTSISWIVDRVVAVDAAGDIVSSAAAWCWGVERRRVTAADTPGDELPVRLTPAAATRRRLR